MKRTLLVMTLAILRGWAAGDACAAPDDAAALIERARASRAAAERKLSESRDERTRERQALAGKLHSVYERLDKARTAADAARSDLESLETAAGEAEARTERLRRQAADLVRRAFRALEIGRAHV